MHVLILELIVDAELAADGEPALGTEVVVSKVVAVAGGLYKTDHQHTALIYVQKRTGETHDEGESERVVGGGGAPIRGPVQGGRVPVVAAGGELREREAKGQFVRDNHGALALDKRLTGGRESSDRRGQAGEGSEELHGWMCERRRDEEVFGGLEGCLRD